MTPKGAEERACADLVSVRQDSEAFIAPTRTYLPAAKLTLACLDAAAAAAAIALSVALHGDHTFSQLTLLLPAWLCFASGIYVCGAYESRAAVALKAAVVPLMLAAIAGGALTAAAMHAIAPGRTSVLQGLTAGSIFFVVAMLIRAAAAAGERGLGRLLTSRAIVIGSSEAANAVTELAEDYPHARLQVVGRVQHGTSWHPEAAADDCPVLGALDGLNEIVSEHRIDVIVIAAPVNGNEPLARELRMFRYAGIKVTDYGALYEELAREVSLDHVDGRWLFTAATANSRVYSRYFKRLVDLLGAAVLLVPSSLALAVAAAAIKLTSRGPVLFKQERLGLGGEPFMVLKLRTMREDAEKLTGPMWSTDNDPRITPVGRVLRKFRVDELPQLVNVLRGEMSLIGPRPERAVFTEKIAKALPLFTERLMVRPGITGWAQVMAPYAMSVEDSRRKLQFDLYYAKHMSFCLDALIAVKTVKTMLFGRERTQGGLTAGAQLDNSEAQLGKTG